jgi:transcriptional regulator with XRE-family HTH domain
MSSLHAQAIVPTREYHAPRVAHAVVATLWPAYTLEAPVTDIERKRRIAYAIRSAREVRGLSRPELAGLVGVGRGAVSDWENAETLPSLLNLGPLCDALQVDADLFAHPPEVPESPVSRYLLKSVADQAADYAVDEALGGRLPGVAPEDLESQDPAPEPRRPRAR